MRVKRREQRMGEAAAFAIGTEKVSIFVPSRYGSGQPVPVEVRNNQVRVVAGVLAREFGGASAEDVAGRANRIVGTFRHQVDRSERFVDEEVLRVWAAVDADALSRPAARAAVLAAASTLRDELAQ